MDLARAINERCRNSGCPLFDPLRGTCGLVERESSLSGIRTIFHQVACPIFEHLKETVAGMMRRRGRAPAEADDVVHSLAEKFLSRTSAEAGSVRDVLAYLRGAAARQLAAAVRTERGRVLCGNCAEFGLVTRSCTRNFRRDPLTGETLAHSHFLSQAVHAERDPGTLQPPCHEFVPRRPTVPLPEEAAAAPDAADPDAGSEALEALESLAAKDWRLAWVVRLKAMEGRSYEEIARVLPLSERHLKRLYRLVLEDLRRILLERSPDFVSPAGPSGKLTSRRASE